MTPRLCCTPALRLEQQRTLLKHCDSLDRHYQNMFYPSYMALKIGDKAPRISLPNADNQIIHLSDFKGHKVILYFYPKDLTPGCTQESCDFQSLQPKMRKNGVVVLGISKDSPARHKKFIEKYGFEFDLLSDEDGAVCNAYDVWKEKSLYGKKYMGIERTTYVINESGKIEAVYEKVKVKGHAEEVMAAMKA